MVINYIESKILTDDHNKIFFDIYNNFNDYNFVNKEYCKNYLIIVFSELFDKDIDLTKINNMIDINDEHLRTEQNNFRKQIVSRFNTCLISNIHNESCEASHIYDLKYEPLNYDINNGILLNASLHKEFDQYKWCIEPVSYEIIVSTKYKHQNLEINKYTHVNLTPILNKYPNMQFYLRKKYNKFSMFNK